MSEPPGFLSPAQGPAASVCLTLDRAPVRSWQVLLVWLGGRPGPGWGPSPRWPGQGRFRQPSSATAVSRWPACCRNSLPGGGGRALAEKAVCTAGQQPGQCVCSQLESRLGHCISKGPPPKPRTRARPEHAPSWRPQVTGPALLQTTPAATVCARPGQATLVCRSRSSCHATPAGA